MRKCMGCMEEVEDHLNECSKCAYIRNTPPKEAYHMPPESILAERYIVGRVLGYGGFGVTYLGYDAQLERKVAIKEFLPSTFATRMPGYTEITVYGGEATEQFEAGLERFVEEAKRLAAFNGIGGIVDIYDTFVENNTAYIIMEYLQGVDVKVLLEANGPMPFEEAREIILKICETLEPVHKEGIIHRDISPDNIFITQEGEVKLLDFGASRYATSINSKSLSVILKAGYAPEEQYRSRGDQGAWSDVYALAATFYKMITGITPMDAMERGIDDTLKEPSQLGIKIEKPAENAIMNALNIRKEDRTSSISEFRTALLSQEVSRTKVKQRKSDNGQLSLWMKMLIGGSLLMALVLVVLTVTGVITIGKTNVLKDEFGSAVPEGYVNAPGIVNLSEDQAQQLMRKIGLLYLIVGKEYSDDIEKGKILSQMPLPGRVIKLGETIEITISGGRKSDAIAAGEVSLPDVTYMKVNEAIYEMKSKGFYYHTSYEFSDTVTEGLIIRMEEFEGGRGAKLYVSLGKNEESGEMRAAYMEHTGDGMILNIGIDSSHYDNTNNHYPTYQISCSEDKGRTWENLLSKWGNIESYRPYKMSYDNGTSSVQLRVDLEELITLYNPHLMGKDLMYQIEKVEEPNNNGESNIIETMELEEVLRVEEELTAVQIDSIESYTAKEIKDKINKGELNERNDLRYVFERGEEEQYNFYCFRGNMKQYEQYKLIHDTNYRNHAYCDKAGELWVASYKQESNNNNSVMMWSILRVSEAELLEQANWSIKTAESYHCFYKEGSNLVHINNNTQEEIISGIEDLLGQPIGEQEVKYQYKENYQEGNVIRCYYDTYREDIKITFFIALGKKEVGKYGSISMPTIVKNRMYAPQIKFLLSGVDKVEEGEYTSYELSYSVDAGRTWKELKNKEGYRYRHGWLPFEPEKDSLLEETYLSLGQYLFVDNLALADRSLTFRMDRLISTNEGDKLIDQIIINRPFLFTVEDKKVSVSSTKKYEWNQVDELVKEGRISEDSVINSYYQSFIQYNHEMNEDIYLLTGSFRKGHTYYIMSENTVDTSESFMCYREGELFMTQYKGSDRAGKYLIQQVDYEDLKEGGIMAKITKPSYVNLDFK